MLSAGKVDAIKPVYQSWVPETFGGLPLPKIITDSLGVGQAGEYWQCSAPNYEGPNGVREDAASLSLTCNLFRKSFEIFDPLVSSTFFRFYKNGQYTIK